jgi:hypothetical protein
LVKGDFDFIVSRCLDFVDKRQSQKKSKHELQNGILYLKGGFNRLKIFQKPHNTIWLISSKMNF